MAFQGRELRGGWFAKTYDPLLAGSIDGTDTEPHDHAIHRAMRTHCKKPGGANGIYTDAEKTLFIGQLSGAMTSEDLKKSLSHYGSIQEAVVVRNKITGISCRYGFVTFQDPQSALQLHKAARKHTISITFTPKKRLVPSLAIALKVSQGSEMKDSEHMDVDMCENRPTFTTLTSTALTTAVPRTDTLSKPVLVDFERARVMKGWIPRRLGGGLGGKKESGQLRFGGGMKPFRKPIGNANMPLDMQEETCWHPLSKDDRHTRDRLERSDYRPHHRTGYLGQSRTPSPRSSAHASRRRQDDDRTRSSPEAAESRRRSERTEYHRRGTSRVRSSDRHSSHDRDSTRDRYPSFRRDDDGHDQRYQGSSHRRSRAENRRSEDSSKEDKRYSRGSRSSYRDHGR